MRVRDETVKNSNGVGAVSTRRLSSFPRAPLPRDSGPDSIEEVVMFFSALIGPAALRCAPARRCEFQLDPREDAPPIGKHCVHARCLASGASAGPALPPAFRSRDGSLPPPAVLHKDSRATRPAIHAPPLRTYSASARLARPRERR